MKNYILALNSALGVKRYVIGSLITSVASLYQYLANKFQDWGAPYLSGVPTWTIALITLLSFVAWCVISRLAFLEGRAKDARVELAKLRREGVDLRNQALYQNWHTSEWEVWNKKINQWEVDVIASIEKIDKAYAEWFRILDIVPSPRLSPSSIPSGELTISFRSHDYRLLRLGEMIYGLWKAPI